MISSMISPRSSNSPQKTDPAKDPAKDLAGSGVSAWLAPILYFLGYYFLMPFFFRELTVIGTENIPKTGTVIIAPTHRSRWDALVVPYAIGRIATGRDPRYMVSIDEMQGIQGWFISRMGGFPVDTKNPGSTLFRYCIELLKQAQMLVIFPEGNIFRHQKVNPIKPGLARIALQVENTSPQLETKILPMSIRYSEAYPRWRGAFQVCIGSPIVVAEYVKYTPKTATQKLTEDLEAQIKAVDALNAPPWVLKSEDC